MEWESVFNDQVDIGGVFSRMVYISRARVPGGWIILSVIHTSSPIENMFFCPDPNHEWQI